MAELIVRLSPPTGAYGWRSRNEHVWINGNECKWCGTCRQYVATTLFAVNNRTWDRCANRCKTCVNRSKQVKSANNRPLEARNRLCAACNVRIPDTCHVRQKFCSVKCQQFAFHHPGQRRVLNRHCKACNKLLPESAPYRQIFCSNSCRSWYKDTPYKGQILKRTGRVCANPCCNTSIDHKHLRAKYCSKSCLYKVRHQVYGAKNNWYRTQNRSKEAWSIARDWCRLVNRYNHCCAYCGKYVEKLQQDHVVPRIRGGRHTIGNLLPACSRCNSSKNSSLLIEWKYHDRKEVAIENPLYGSFMAPPPLRRS